jgi:hypothetical protein
MPSQSERCPEDAKLHKLKDLIRSHKISKVGEMPREMLHFATLGRWSVISFVHFVLVLPRNLSKLLAIQGLEAATCTQCQASDWSNV